MLCSDNRAKVGGWISEGQLWAVKIKGNWVPEKSWGSQLSGAWGSSRGQCRKQDCRFKIERKTFFLAFLTEAKSLESVYLDGTYEDISQYVTIV